MVDRMEPKEITMPKVQQILGVDLASSILPDLQKLSSYSGEPIAAVYADNLLRTMRTMRDKLPFDPYTEVVMALHDALAFQNKWIDYNASQYQGVYDLIKTLVNREQLELNEVESAILTLENLGFDTLPFGWEFDSRIEIDDDEC